MCAIFVVFSKKDVPLDVDRCQSSLQKMFHRGPDFVFDSFQFDNRLYMGQMVLSITGTPDSELVNYQVSNNDRFNIVLNGEVYNYKALVREYLSDDLLLTDSDTEVLVNLHENMGARNVPNVLDGMYAYCAYDRHKKELYVARDLIGEKILYQYEDDDYLLLASEISGILHFLRKGLINQNSIHQYFYSRHFLNLGVSEYQKIEAFPAGRCICISLPSLRKRLVFSKTLKDLVSVERYDHLSNLTESEVLREFDQICRSTAKKLSPKVDYASVFSGGVDSSIASWYMLQEGNKPKVLSGLVFKEKDDISEKLDIFEEKVNAKITSISVSKDQFIAGMKKFYRDYKTLMPTHSFVSQMILSQSVKNMDCKVLIGGDGADELFGGYEYYKKFKHMKKEVEQNPSPYSGYVESTIEFDGYDSCEHRQHSKARWREALELFSHVKDRKERYLQSVLYLDSLIELESVGLRSSDLMSMANSVEGRSFFVTKEMLEFAINLPIKYKIDFTEKDPLLITKPLLKKAYIKIFGKDLLFEKQGFSGYPNESAEEILAGDYALFQERLSPMINFEKLHGDRALEWKVMNVSMLLKTLEKENF